MTEDDRQIKSIQTAFSIIEQLKLKDGATVSEVAEELGRAKSTIYFHLRTLNNVGYVVKQGEEYAVGYRFLDLGSFAREQSLIYNHSRSKVDALADETNESAWLLAEDHGKGIYLYNARGERSVRTMSRIGLQTYLNQTAAGKSILAFSSRSKVDSIIEQYGLPAQTKNTITDREELFDELETIREQGFALNREESLDGIHAVGAPIQDSDGDLLGAISVSGPANRISNDRFEEALPNKVLGIANEIEIHIAHANDA